MATRATKRASAKKPRAKAKADPAVARAKKRAKAQQKRLDQLLSVEREHWAAGRLVIAGLDEVGAGPLAGPVTAACVVLDPDKVDLLLGVDDSKKVPAEERELLADLIKSSAHAWAVASASVAEIDEINILQAALLAMKRALADVAAQLGAIDHLLIDARKLDVPYAQTPIIKGDATSLSIAAASILAKVARDAEMAAYGAKFPGYGFERHKGYATEEHLEALRVQGVSPIHRRTFAPISTMLTQLSLFDPPSSPRAPTRRIER
ncbi:ribonuclease HII [Myxococcota bacterium]|nr:ribonuclease HII [Myxococcota bacterium]